MSNCVVAPVPEPSNGTGIPSDVVADHGVQGGDDFAHHSHDGDLRFLSSGREAFVEGLERRIVAARRQSRHVEYSPNGCAPTPDAAHPFHLATVEVVGRDADYSGDLLAAHLAEFR